MIKTRNIGLIRQWRFLLALDGNKFGLSLRQLAEMGGVTERTVRRDMDTLILSGFPVRATTMGGSVKFLMDAKEWKGAARLLRDERRNNTPLRLMP